MATKWGQANSVNLLLDHGAKIDAKTRVSLSKKIHGIIKNVYS